MKFAARLEVGLFDVVQRGRTLASAYPAELGRDSELHSPGLADVANRARSLEAIGFDGVYTIEAAHDVFFPLVLAASATDLDLMTDPAVAFPRSPMHLAHQAYDLQLLSRGRFVLGLGCRAARSGQAGPLAGHGRADRRCRASPFAVRPARSPRRSTGVIEG